MLQKLSLNVTHAAKLEDERKIPSELASEMGVVSMGPNLAFEFRRNGVCIYRQVKRETMVDGQREKTFYIEPKGSALFFWNDDCLNDNSSSEILIITEGVEDALSWLEAGATHVVSVPNGTPDKPGQGDIDPEDDHRFAYLWVGEPGKKRLDPRISRFKKIILSTDADKAGAVLREELAIRLGRSRCWWVEYPKGAKDANETLVRHGADVLTDVLDGARPVVPTTLVKFSDIPKSIKTPRSFGWAEADPFMRFVAPQLIVLTGRPGSGKSLLALAMVANLAWNHALPGVILQFEDDVERNRGDLIRFAISKQDGNFHSMEDIDRGAAWVDRYFRTIAPPELSEGDDDFAGDAEDLKWLVAKLEEAARVHGAKWALIDPWNEIEHMWGRNFNETQYLNHALRTLKRQAKRLGMSLFIVAHPTKEGGLKDDIEQMSLYDISGGQAWANKADIGIIAHRENPTHLTTFVKIDKTKNHALMGTPGIFRLKYQAASANYEWAGVYTKAV